MSCYMFWNVFFVVVFFFIYFSCLTLKGKHVVWEVPNYFNFAQDVGKAALSYEKKNKKKLQSFIFALKLHVWE